MTPMTPMTATLAPPAIATDRAAVATTKILAGLTTGYSGNFNVRLWNGVEWQPNTGPIRFTLVLQHPGALRAMFRPVNGAVAFGEAYVFDDFDIEGDIIAFTEWLRHLVERGEQRGLTDKLRLYRRSEETAKPITAPGCFRKPAIRPVAIIVSHATARPSRTLTMSLEKSTDCSSTGICSTRAATSPAPKKTLMSPKSARWIIFAASCG